jgi:hypothetical protein
MAPPSRTSEMSILASTEAIQALRWYRFALREPSRKGGRCDESLWSLQVWPSFVAP